MQHQQNLYHVFIDFNKAFDRVWHAALWATMRKYNIGVNLVLVIEHLYDNATRAGLMNGTLGEWFRTTIGVHQSWLPSPIRLNVFLEGIVTAALKNHVKQNVHFADDISGLVGDEQELVNLVSRLGQTSTPYGTEISAEKTKLMTNNINGINKKITVNGQRLETVSNFKYLGSVVIDEGSKLEIISRIAQTTATLTRLKPIWKDKNITLRSKIRLMRSLVVPIFL